VSNSQTPLGSAFGAASTAQEVVRGHDLTGKTALVTGGYSGIGVETSRALKEAGAHVIVPVRDRAKAARTLEGLDVEIEDLDLARPSSIDALADRLRGRPLHILINSAGIMACDLTRDERGYESQFATNHLGHFQLVERLWPALQRAQGARVVAVSSWGHRRSPVVFEDPNFERREYEPWSAYGQSKTANILFALELDRRGSSEGVRAFSLHPGSIVTDLGRHLSREDLKAFGVIDEAGEPIIDPSKNMKTPQQGAATSVWCAVSPLLEGKGGLYCENCDVSPLLSENAEPLTAQSAAARGQGSSAQGVLPYAIDPENARRLWALSEKLLN
jgi:NAD(P)-dependent dehydrogenase (short-subunit alcohol dehydrogenase family)